MIERPAGARGGRRFSLLHEDQHLAVLQALDAALERRAFATEPLLVPGEGGLRIRRAQVDVVEAETIAILQHFDSRSPGILDDAEPHPS